MEHSYLHVTRPNVEASSVCQTNEILVFNKQSKLIREM